MKTKRYSLSEVEALVNWDHLLCKPPFRNELEERQYYGRYLRERLWRYLKPKDWKRLSQIIDTIRIPEKTKLATKWLIQRKLGKTSA